MRWGSCSTWGVWSPLRCGFGALAVEHTVPPGPRGRHCSGAPARRLAVESHEVRCSQDAGDGGSTAEARVGTVPVVVMEPEGQRAAPLVGVAVQARIGPLEQGGLDEALDLAVGPRGIGPGEEMAQAEPLTGRAEAARAISRTRCR